MSADDLLGSHEQTHNIVEESAVAEEEPAVNEEEKADQQIKNPE